MLYCTSIFSVFVCYFCTFWSATFIFMFWIHNISSFVSLLLKGRWRACQNFYLRDVFCGGLILLWASVETAMKKWDPALVQYKHISVLTWKKDVCIVYFCVIQNKIAIALFLHEIEKPNATHSPLQVTLSSPWIGRRKKL